MENSSPSRIEIWKMFDRIAGTYDKVNRFMTMGLDLYWRKKMSFFLPPEADIAVLDCATGTGDQLLSFFKHANHVKKGVGIDLSSEMLNQAQVKVQKKGLNHCIELKTASALDIPFRENAFDATSISFGIRNVTNVDLCLREMFRVLKPKGRLLILETSISKIPLIKTAHLFYLRKILPLIGGFFSNNKKAYQYLNQTTETFPSREAFCAQIENTGFLRVKCHPLTFGAVSIYVAEKP